MAGSDPGDRAARDVGVHEVTTWQPRSPMDRLAVVVHASLVYAAKWSVVLVGLVLTAAIATVTTLDFVLDPFISALVALSVLPALALAAYVRYADVTTEEPLSVLSVTFLIAVLTASIAVPLSLVGTLIVESFTAPLGRAVGAVLTFVLIVGPVEEAVKLLAVRLYAYDHERFDAVIDGAVYGAAAGLGFATIENALYITDVVGGAGGLAAASLGEIGEITAARTVAGPGHVLYSAVAGYYLGLAKYTPQHWGQIVTKGLIVAGLFHGIYNATVGVGAFLLASLTGLPTLGGAVVYIVLYLTLVGYYLYRKLDRYRRTYRKYDGGDEPGLPQRADAGTRHRR